MGGMESDATAASAGGGPAAAERFDAELAARREDLIGLTSALIRFPTVNPPGAGYRELCDFLAERLARRGFEVELLRAEGALGDSDRYPRWNLVARRGGAHAGDCLHFNSHSDVVAPGQGWTLDPFAGTVRDGRVYGRGACDMKGGLAASIVAAETFVDLFPRFAGAIELSATCDEESGGFGGVAWLAERGRFDPSRVQHVIIPEPLNKERICLGHRGVWWAEIETRGRIAHGSMPFLGDCAVRHMAAVIERMERDLWPALAGRRTAMPVVPDGARASTLNVNALHGGETEEHDGLPAPNVPHSCRMTIDRRFIVEESIDDVRSEVIGLLDGLRGERPGFDYAVREIMRVLPTMTDADAPVVRALERGIGDVLGRTARHVASPGTYDQKHFARLGHLQDCVAYGPGILELAHQPDEFVVIDDMVASAQVMARAVDALLSADGTRV